MAKKNDVSKEAVGTETLREQLKGLSNDELVERYRNTWSAVYESGCYGVDDLAILALIGANLFSKGYEIEMRTVLTITPPDTDNDETKLYPKLP